MFDARAAGVAPAGSLVKIVKNAVEVGFDASPVERLAAQFGKARAQIGTVL